MKVFLIILLVLILFYLFLNKNENFNTSKKLTSDLMENFNTSEKLTSDLIEEYNIEVEKINEFNLEEGSREMTYGSYNYILNMESIKEFKNKMGTKKLESINNSFKKRNNLFINNFNSRDSYLKYIRYLDFKKIKYINATRFIETFEPNIILTTYLNSDEEDNVRIKYELTDEKGNLFKNNIYYKEQAVEIDGSDYKIIKNNSSDKYSYLDYVEKFIEDIKDTEDADVKKDYSFAFEDFNRIDMNHLESIDSDELKDHSVGETKYKKIETKLYILPGKGDCKLKIIIEGKNPPKHIFYSIKYNFDKSTSKEEFIKPTGEEKNVNQIVIEKPSGNTNNNKYNYISNKISQLRKDISSIEFPLKGLENKIIIHKKDTVDDPSRCEKYVNLMILKTYLDYKKEEKKDEEKNEKKDEEKDELDELFKIFKIYYVKKEDDRRQVTEAGKNLETYREIELQKLNLIGLGFDISENESILLTNLTKELEVEKFNILGHQVYDKTDVNKKYKKLKEIYEEIIKHEKFKAIMGVKKLKVDEKIISQYLKKELNVDNNVDNTKDFLQKLINIEIENKINENGNVDIKIVEPVDKTEKDTINQKFKKKFESNYISFEVEKKNEVPHPVESQEENSYSKPDTPVKEVDDNTLEIRKFIKLIQKNFREIIDMKKYDNLNPELEGELKFLVRKKKFAEDKKNLQRANNYKKMIDIIIKFISKIKEGKIGTINDLLEYKEETYTFPSYIDLPFENFSNINIMKPIYENFVDIHKHTSQGRIEFNQEFGDPERKENEGKYDEYTLLNENSKKNVLKSYQDIHDVLVKANNTVNQYVDGIDKNIGFIDYKKIETQTNNSIKQIEKTQDEMDKNYNDIEKKQNEKIYRITDKIRDLEKLQNKKYLNDLDSYNSLKSFSDGQVISIKNISKDNYSILVNKDCLDYNKNGDISTQKCTNSKSQQFTINMVDNMNKYNNIVTSNGGSPVNEYDNITYPFNVLNPVLHKSQCLTLNGNSIGVKECINSNKQRWEGLKNIKLCDNFNMN
tara:strand:- start:2899 stop:5976 length:3078 start_codon:yes stop_codon:yes gene_type:complete